MHTDFRLHAHGRDAAAHGSAPRRAVSTPALQ